MCFGVFSVFLIVVFDVFDVEKFKNDCDVDLCVLVCFGVFVCVFVM